MKKSSLFALLLLTALSFSLSFSLSGCNIIRGIAGVDRLYFCEKYDPVNDLCEGRGEKFGVGTIAVMADLKMPVGVDEVFINVKVKDTGENVNNFPFSVKPDMDYINFKGVTFTTPGTYKVSLIKNDGTVIASNDLEIIN